MRRQFIEGIQHRLLILLAQGSCHEVREVAHGSTQQPAASLASAEARALALVARLKGSIEREDGVLVGIDLHESAISDADVAELAGLTSLRRSTGAPIACTTGPA